VVFLLAEVVGADRPSCVVLPADGRGGPTWALDEIDKLGYRGVESAAYAFTAHHAAGAEVLGGADGLGAGARQMLDALDVGRVNVACRALGIVDRALACAVDECTGREIGEGVVVRRLRQARAVAPRRAAAQIGEGANDALLLALAKPHLEEVAG
jgi:alkylation response protein AidB-like acyl-CoA dehydrogenase